MQNFGSSSHRFKSGNDWKSFLGPGKYNPSISVSQSPMKPLVKIPFLSSNERFDNKISNGIPGPGNYSNFKVFSLYKHKIKFYLKGKSKKSNFKISSF